MNQVTAMLAVKSKWDIKKDIVINEAIDEWIKVKEDPKMMLFLGLYWGEGSKSFKSCAIQIVNNDPGVLKLSLDIFNEYSPFTNKDIYIRCYPDQNLDECTKYWSKILGTSVKAVIRKEIGTCRKPTSKYGTCTIRFSDWKFRYKIITWLDLLRQSIVGDDTKHITDYHTHYRSVA